MSGNEQRAVKIPQGYGRAAELAARYFEAREVLRERADRIRDIKSKAGSRLKNGLLRRVAACSAAMDALRQEIEEHPELWARPRTRALHGVKVGRRSLPGRLEIDDDAAIPLVRELLPAKAKALVRTRETLVKEAVKGLPRAELAAIGGRIADLGDETVICIPRDAVDKLVEALLESFSEEEAT